MLEKMRSIFRRKPDIPSYEVPKLAELMNAHGFSYLGHLPAKNGTYGSEVHRFSRNEVIFAFGFAYSIYGENFAAVGFMDRWRWHPERMARLSYFIGYVDQQNSLADAGVPLEEALATCLAPHIESIIKAAEVARSHGRIIPMRSDLGNLGAAP